MNFVTVAFRAQALHFWLTDVSFVHSTLPSAFNGIPLVFDDYHYRLAPRPVPQKLFW